MCAFDLTGGGGFGAGCGGSAGRGGTQEAEESSGGGGGGGGSITQIARLIASAQAALSSPIHASESGSGVMSATLRPSGSSTAMAGSSVTR